MSAIGANVFDTSRWEPAIEAAVEQGKRLAPEVARVWHG
jgi:NTE family protein